MPWAAAPLAAKVNAKPAAQPYSVPRCSRQARPKGLRSQADAVGRPGRSGSSPAPWSLSTARTYAATVAAAVSASGRASTHQRFAV